MSLYSDFGDQAYKLLRLSPELLEYLEQPDAILQLKSEPFSSSVVLCTQNKTFKIREAHHSNSMLIAAAKGSAVLRDEAIIDEDGDVSLPAQNVFGIPTKSYVDLPDDSITILNNVPTIWEPVEVESKTTKFPLNLPVYYERGVSSISIEDTLDSDSLDSSRKSCLSLKELKDLTPLSSDEFDELWIAKGGVELPKSLLFPLDGADEFEDRYAVTVDLETVHRVLGEILVAVETSRRKNKKKDGNLGVNEFSDISPINIYSEIETVTSRQPEPIYVIEAVLKKFSNERTDPYTLDMPKIIHWFGVQTLKKHASPGFGDEKSSSLIETNQFMSHWRRSIPIAITSPELTSLFNLTTLAGNFIKLHGNMILFFDSDAAFTNTPDPRSRFSQLFEIKPDWDLNDFWPLVQDVVPPNVKRENYVMKFAKKRKVGNKIMVSKR